jgi:hypothetical protein
VEWVHHHAFLTKPDAWRSTGIARCWRAFCGADVAWFGLRQAGLPKFGVWSPPQKFPFLAAVWMSRFNREGSGRFEVISVPLRSPEDPSPTVVPRRLIPTFVERLARHLACYCAAICG